jgi:hypothetical protein
MLNSPNNNQAIKNKKRCWASLFFCCDPPKKEEDQSLIELNPINNAPPKQFMYQSTSHSELPNRIDLLHGIPMPGSIGFSMLHGI